MRENMVKKSQTETGSRSLLPEGLNDNGAKKNEESREDQRQDGHHLPPDWNKKEKIYSSPYIKQQHVSQSPCSLEVVASQLWWYKPNAYRIKYIKKSTPPCFFALNTVDCEYRLTSLSREGHHIFEGCNHMQHSSTELSTSGRRKMKQNNEINQSVRPPAQWSQD